MSEIGVNALTGSYGGFFCISGTCIIADADSCFLNSMPAPRARERTWHVASP